MTNKSLRDYINLIETAEQGVAEGLPQTLRKVVPGYAKREIDKKMDAGKFGKTDADKDANFQRYKKIQDKIKDQGVAETKLGEGKTEKKESPKPRNFVAKNAINSGAGAHKDKKKAAKQGDVKHKKQLELAETATAGATSAANIGTVDAPHISPGKARGKKSYIGSPGHSGTKAPPQPKILQPKKSDGTAVNGLDIKGSSLFGGPKSNAKVIKRH